LTWQDWGHLYSLGGGFPEDISERWLVAPGQGSMALFEIHFQGGCLEEGAPGTPSPGGLGSWGHGVPEGSRLAGHPC
jgi:hypothetical protein